MVYGASQVVTVRAPSNLLLLIPLGVLLVLGFGAPGRGVARVVWLAVMLGLGVVGGVRVVRMGVLADKTEVVVCNLGRTYREPWSNIESLTIGRSDNISSAVTTIHVRTHSGKRITCRGASSCSESEVKQWCDDLQSASDGRYDTPSSG